MLKLLRATLLSTALFLPLIADRPTFAQEQQGCFFISPAGTFIDLADLCPPPQRAGVSQVGTGDIQITLRWATTDDLDLEVTDPKGNKVTFSNPAISSGGQLDTSANEGCQSSSSNPFEHIFWPPSQAPQGTYTIAVKLFTRCQSSGAIPFTLTLIVLGKTQTLTGSVDTPKPVETFSFSVPLQ